MTDYEHGMYHVLKQLLPNKMESSLHVAEDIYILGEKEFHVYFEIGKTEPFEVEVKVA